MRRAEAWLADASPLDGLDLLTLFHLEMRFGCWRGALTTTYPDAYTFTLYPYAHRDIADAVLGVPWTDRATGRLRDEVIAASAPELSRIAINRRPLHVRFRHGVRRGLGLARRAFAGRP